MSGSYEKSELPELLKKYKAAVVLILSIWPETFSYTYSEAKKCGYPVALFNLGAPAERAEKSDILVDEINAESMYQALLKYLDTKSKN